MPDESADETGRVERLTERIAELKAENERLRNQQQPSHTRRWLLRAAGIAGAGAISLTAATGSATAAPTGTFPAAGDDSLLKIRAERLRLVKRSGAPSSPSSGRVLIYTDSGDL